MAEPSLVGEIAERLAVLQRDAAAPRRVAVIVPLAPGAADAVGELLGHGPPFEPERLERLARHEVLLTQNEAVLLFESGDDARSLVRLLTEADFWQAAIAWREHVAGSPRLAELVYSWTRTEEPGDLSFLPTPGPGDSDGGDIF